MLYMFNVYVFQNFAIGIFHFFEFIALSQICLVYTLLRGRKVTDRWGKVQGEIQVQRGLAQIASTSQFMCSRRAWTFEEFVQFSSPKAKLSDPPEVNVQHVGLKSTIIKIKQIYISWMSKVIVGWARSSNKRQIELGIFIWGAHGLGRCQRHLRI